MVARRKQISGQMQHPSARKVQSKNLRRSSRLAEKARSTPVLFLENGLLSMEKIPGHLVQMYVTSGLLERQLIHNSAENNRTTSRLLLLPAQIRKMIWDYATIGHTINLSRAYDRSFLGWPSEACFCLTQVCRQIYAETALLGYRLSTFFVTHWSLFHESWTDKLLPIQKNAIKTIRLAELLFYKFLVNPSHLPINAYFPNLKTVEIVRCYHYPLLTQMGVHKFGISEITHPHVALRNTARNSLWTLGELRHMGEKWALEQTRVRAGNSVDIIFGDPSHLDP